MLSKGCKPGHFESQNSLKLSLANICGLHSNFVDCKSFLEWNSPDILALCEWEKRGWLVKWFWQFLCEGLPSFNLKGFYYPYPRSHSLCEGRISFCMELVSRKLCRFLLMFLAGFTSLIVFFFLYRLPSLSLCTIFDFISFSIDQVLSIKLSANVFFFGGFNVHHQCRLTYSQTTLLRWLTFLLGS